MWYQKYLRRTATSNEVNNWLTIFNRRGIDEQIIADTLGFRRVFQSSRNLRSESTSDNAPGLMYLMQASRNKSMTNDE